MQFSYNEVISFIRQLQQNEILLKEKSDMDLRLKEMAKQLKISEKQLTETQQKLEKCNGQLHKVININSSSKLYTESEFQKKLEANIFEIFSQVFTRKQIEKIFYKQKRKNWSEIDMARAIAIYNCS